MCWWSAAAAAHSACCARQQAARRWSYTDSSRCCTSDTGPGVQGIVCTAGSHIHVLSSSVCLTPSHFYYYFTWGQGLASLPFQEPNKAHRHQHNTLRYALPPPSCSPTPHPPSHLPTHPPTGQVLHRAKGDKRVKGLLAVLGDRANFGGMAQLQELRNALLDFRVRSSSADPSQPACIV